MKSQAFGWKPVLRYLLVLFMLTGANLYGATHTVSNEGGLINAITAVNASLEDDTITFTGNIGLEAALPDINKATGSLTIEGNGYTLSRNTGAIAFRVLYIENGVVTIDRLTVSGGLMTGLVEIEPDGGGIYNRDTLILENCTVTGNTAQWSGGGIFNAGALTLTNCTVSGNTAGWDGGGIYNVENMILENCTVSDNEAGMTGGGISNEDESVTLIRSIIGGNTASDSGSEIINFGTISANAHNVFGNSGLTTAEAFYGFTPGATDVTCTSDAPLIGIHRPTALASILSPLADNGGPTQTHALVAGGPAIDRDQVSLAGSYPATDQRGVVRPYGLGVDAGAYEYPSFQSMSVSPGHRDFAAAGGDQNVTVTSSVVWTVTYAPDWLTITPISGNGDWSVTLTASANSGLYRTGSITFSANGVTDVTVNVSQASGVVPPPVSTFVASGIGLEEATLGGNVSADGGAAVTARGVVYSSIDSTPTIGESGVTQVSIGNGTGDFSQAVSGLTPGTTYYVCAYATNGAGTGYGAVTSFSTLDLPGVTTQDPTEITPTTATLNGNIDALGVPAATQHGFVWDTSANPTVALSTKSEQGVPSASGAFHYALTGLTPGAVYYVRAYITNDAGTAYGEDKPFVASNLTLSVTPETLNLPAAGSTVEVNVTSNTAWTASSDQSWLGLSPASGTNDGLVELTASPNLAWGSRSAVVTFSADGVISRTVTVTQASGQSDGDLGLVLNSPTDELVQAGESLIKVFRLVNASAHAVNVTLSVACSQPGWMASIPGGATAVVDASGHLDIPTQVEVAAGAMPGDRCDVSLSVVTEALEVSNSVELTVTLNRIAISPLPADFGLVPMGSPAVQSLSLVNHGDEPMMVGTVTVSGSGLTIMNDGVSGQTIPAGASRALQLQFNPLAAGVVNGQLNWPIQAPHAESILTGVTGTGLYTPPPPPPPEPEPILEEHHHNLLGNTARFNLWNLDPNGLLPQGTAWSVVQGTLPGGLRIRDGWVAGIFRNTGSYSFQLKAETDAVTVIHTFTVRVMTPTVCPTIFGAWINGDYLSIEVLEDARHGVAAQTAPMRMTLEPGQSTEIRFDWDYIKDDFSFRLIDGDLPLGLILDGDSGVISGVPSASGSYRFLVSVKDWRGRGYQWVEVNIP